MKKTKIHLERFILDPVKERGSSDALKITFFFCQLDKNLLYMYQWCKSPWQFSLKHLWIYKNQKE